MVQVNEWMVYKVIIDPVIGSMGSLTPCLK